MKYGCCKKHDIVFRLLSLGCNKLSSDHLYLFYRLSCIFFVSFLQYKSKVDAVWKIFICGIVAIQSLRNALSSFHNTSIELL